MSRLISMLPTTGYIVGKSIDTGIITVAASALGKTFGVIGSILGHKNIDITMKLEQLEVQYNLDMVGSVLQNVEHNPMYNVSKNQDDFDVVQPFSGATGNPLLVNLSYISKSIESIYTILEEINVLVGNHNAKYFKNWRNLDVKNQLTALEHQITILKSRFNDYVKLSSLGYIQ